MDVPNFSTRLTPKDVHIATSIKELAEIARPPPLDQKIDAKKYARSAMNVLQQGRVYLAEGDLENAYILMLRYATLVIEMLPKHRGYSTLTEKSTLRKQILTALPEIEDIKKQLADLYETAEKKKQEEAKRKEEEQMRIRQQLQQEQQLQEQASLQQQQQVPYQPGGTPGQLGELQKYVERQQSLEYKNFGSLEDQQKNEQDTLYHQMDPSEYQKLSLQQQPYVPKTFTNSAPPEYIASASTSEPPKGDVMFPPYVQGSQTAPPPYPGTNMIIPQVPPVYHSPTAPPFPGAVMMPGMATPPVSMPTTSHSQINASHKVDVPQAKQSVDSKPVDKITGLRQLHMDGEMFSKFMELAKSNTSRKIETCGILAGTLKQNVFYVTTLIIPKQEGTPDTCNMTNEDELFMYQTENDLMTLGWIHTHPTQECFLSSVDLHTHSGYQFLLKEAVAVVIAPMFSPNFGIFSLTDIGLQVIESCEKKGFHPHEKGLYNTCKHVTLNWGNPTYKMVDLRK